ncbi:MAG: ATP-binding cassette domain-containing protein [Peptococcaceae bacterium]|nr:ATP-binding cassette domain-containing protein [Peptococcaceae bacterium]
MTNIVLETKSLTKRYKDTMALDHVSIAIPQGKIVGFIGQNGAGKTTFLRMVTGLAFPTSGSMALWGHSDPLALQAQRKRIGCMIEGPALYGGMTARQNLEIERLQRGLPDKTLIDRALALVGLEDTGRKRVRHFSMGMRQRLGIAMAILGMPELLILDEPINGLDPAGIVEVRTLLKQLNRDYGMTILISSHILEELYQTASEFILIDRGRIIEMLSTEELDERCKRHIAIKTTMPQRELLALKETLHTEAFRLMPDDTIRLYDYLNDVEIVAQALAEAGVLVTGLSVSGETLEDYFLDKIGGAHHA